MAPSLFGRLPLGALVWSFWQIPFIRALIHDAHPITKNSSGSIFYYQSFTKSITEIFMLVFEMLVSFLDHWLGLVYIARKYNEAHRSSCHLPPKVTCDSTKWESTVWGDCVAKQPCYTETRSKEGEVAKIVPFPFHRLKKHGKASSSFVQKEGLFHLISHSLLQPWYYKGFFPGRVYSHKNLENLICREEAILMSK